MSKPRPSGHRKSQSTSALSVLASPSSSSTSGITEHRKLRASQYPALGRVDESASPSSASIAHLPGLCTPGRQTRGLDDGVGGEEVRGWMNDVMSLRSSDRRRLAALRGLEKTLIRCCASSLEKGKSRMSGITLDELVGLQLHTALISLVTRHAQTLAHHSPNADAVDMIVGEMGVSVRMLQGLCLLSAGCKAAVGEAWVIEIFIDLLLQLRAHSQATVGGSRPIVYGILELLFCVLVDSPVNARTFERLSGLEAVVRILKGTAVAKEVRMKCIEFLYFYLLPEQSPSARSVSSASASSSSSGESNLFPPSPLSSSTSSNESDGRISPSPAPIRKPASTPVPRYADIDMAFVPQTPRKPPQPALGYLTPSTSRRTSGSTSLTPSLPTVQASPRFAGSPSSQHLAAMAESPDEQPPTPRREKRSSALWTKPDSEGGSTIGLGFGLPKSTSIVNGISHQDPPEPPTPTFSDPFGSDSRSSSSGSSTVLASPRSAISRSSTQPSLSIVESSPRNPSTHTRATSTRRVSRSPLVQSMTHGQPFSPEIHPSNTFAGEEIHPSNTSERGEKPRDTTQMKHSRTQSHLSGLPQPPPPDVPNPQRRQSLAPPASAQPSHSPAQSTPSRPGRGFPSELTRGLPSSASSPILSPLTASKRIPSDKRPPNLASPRPPVSKLDRGFKDVRSVEEKKELLGSWLGNVDALVHGVEKVGFWGSINKGRRG